MEVFMGKVCKLRFSWSNPWTEWGLNWVTHGRSWKLIVDLLSVQCLITNQKVGPLIQIPSIYGSVGVVSEIGFAIWVIRPPTKKKACGNPHRKCSRECNKNTCNLHWNFADGNHQLSKVTNEIRSSALGDLQFLDLALCCSLGIPFWH